MEHSTLFVYLVPQSCAAFRPAANDPIKQLIDLAEGSSNFWPGAIDFLLPIKIQEPKELDIGYKG